MCVCVCVLSTCIWLQTYTYVRGLHCCPSKKKNVDIACLLVTLCFFIYVVDECFCEDSGSSCIHVEYIRIRTLGCRGGEREINRRDRDAARFQWIDAPTREPPVGRGLLLCSRTRTSKQEGLAREQLAL